MFVAVNAENAPCTVDARGAFDAEDLLTGERVHIDGAVPLEPYAVRYLRRV